MEWVVGIWAIVVGIAILNLCAAGVAAVMHAWRSKMRRGGRIVTAAAVTGFLPASTLLAAGIAETAWSSTAEEPLVMGLAFAMLLTIGMVVSLPGALLVARKLEAPGDDYRSFE